MAGERDFEPLNQSSLDATNGLRQAIYAQEASAIRSLQVINAGGAVALLAFLGQIWNAAPELRFISAMAILIMSAGLILGVACEFSQSNLMEKRYRRNETSQSNKEFEHAKLIFDRIKNASFASFLVSIFLMVLGILCLLIY